MWDYLKNLFTGAPIGTTDPISSDEDEEEDEDDEIDAKLDAMHELSKEVSLRSPAKVALNPPTLPVFAVSETPFMSIVRQAFEDARDEAAKRERELLDDVKLHKYIKGTTKDLFDKGIKAKDSLFLIYPGNSGVPLQSMGTFHKVFAGLYKEVGIDVAFDDGHDYFVIQTPDFRAAIKKIATSNIDIDERIKAMSSGAPYR